VFGQSGARNAISDPKRQPIKLQSFSALFFSAGHALYIFGGNAHFAPKRQFEHLHFRAKFNNLSADPIRLHQS
jgi:hypothetical protein